MQKLQKKIVMTEYFTILFLSLFRLFLVVTFSEISCNFQLVIYKTHLCYLGVIFSLFSSYLLCSFEMFYLQKYLLHNISLPPPIFCHFPTAVFPFAKEPFCIPHLPLVTCICQFFTLSPLLLLPLSGKQWSRLCSEMFKVLKQNLDPSYFARV